jgi:hypothetical protein
MLDIIQLNAFLQNVIVLIGMPPSIKPEFPRSVHYIIRLTLLRELSNFFHIVMVKF